MRSNVDMRTATILAAVLLRDSGDTYTVTTEQMLEITERDWIITRNNNPQDGSVTFTLTECTAHPNQMALHLPNANTGD